MPAIEPVAGFTARKARNTQLLMQVQLKKAHAWESAGLDISQPKADCQL